MIRSEKYKNFTTVAIGLLMLTFVFYLFTAKPSETFGLNENNEIADIHKMNAKNHALNQAAIIIPEKFVAIESNTKGVYKFVEKMPKFINCEYMHEAEGFICTKRYILNYAEKVQLPKSIKLENDYTVYVKFIVNEKTYIKDVEILNSKPNKLNRIVIDHIKKMPKFAKAGYQNNEAVKVQFIIPVTIKQNKN